MLIVQTSITRTPTDLETIATLTIQNTMVYSETGEATYAWVANWKDAGGYPQSHYGRVRHNPEHGMWGLVSAVMADLEEQEIKINQVPPGRTPGQTGDPGTSRGS